MGQVLCMKLHPPPFTPMLPVTAAEGERSIGVKGVQLMRNSRVAENCSGFRSGIILDLPNFAC